jgi:diguanylate cyclase (GGDEF)-like protein
MGGEEFGFFGIFENETKMIEFGDKILRVIHDAGIVHEFNKDFGVVTVSIGLSISTCQQNKTFEQLYNEADDALYISKKNGRNTLTVYDG